MRSNTVQPLNSKQAVSLWCPTTPLSWSWRKRNFNCGCFRLSCGELNLLSLVSQVFNLYSLNMVSFFLAIGKTKTVTPHFIIHVVYKCFVTPWVLCNADCSVVCVELYSSQSTQHYTVQPQWSLLTPLKRNSNFTCVLFSACRYQCKNYFHDFCLPVSLSLVIF